VYHDHRALASMFTDFFQFSHNAEISQVAVSGPPTDSSYPADVTETIKNTGRVLTKVCKSAILYFVWLVDVFVHRRSRGGGQMEAADDSLKYCCGKAARIGMGGLNTIACVGGPMQSCVGKLKPRTEPWFRPGLVAFRLGT
jgi:hypothetical protein